MNATTRLTRTVWCVLVTALTFVSPARAADSVTSECQSEATLYEIPAEQQADYVAGCIASRGGFAAMDPAAEAVPEDNAEGAEVPVGEAEEEYTYTQ